jgi:hypothetical protein
MITKLAISGYRSLRDIALALGPLFVNRQQQVFDTAIDIAYLKHAQAHVAELACNVIDTVTRMGWQFPGGAGPGKPIMERS